MFDLELPGREVAPSLSAKGVSGVPPRQAQITRLADRLRVEAETHEASIDSPDAAELREHAASMAKNTSVALLIDQSGSVVNRMPGLAGQLRAVVETLANAQVPVAVLGFTTCGWRGGRSREAWVRAGSPEYPGRLCDLLHVVYKDFDRPIEVDDWQAMLRADILFENVDGEALEWGRAQLDRRTEKNRLLVVISDGASVDDSTLFENGAGYLERHLLATIDDITKRNEVTLAAIGIGHQVDRYYARSEIVQDEADFPIAFLNLCRKFAAERDQNA